MLNNLKTNISICIFTKNNLPSLRDIFSKTLIRQIILYSQTLLFFLVTKMSIGRFFSRIMNRVLRRTMYRTERKIGRKIERTGSNMVDKGTSKFRRGDKDEAFDPATGTEEQFAAYWPAIPLDHKKQLIDEDANFKKIPEDMKENMLAINYNPKELSKVTDQEKETMTKAYGFLSK